MQKLNMRRGVRPGPVMALVVLLFNLGLVVSGGSVRADAPPFPNGWVWQNPLPQGFDLYGVACPGDQQCVAVGISGTVVSSSPATGGHWQNGSSGTTNNLTNVDCVSADVCVAVGVSGTVRRTINAGQSWSPAPITATADLGAINCLSDGTCYTYDTAGHFFKSSDGGASWNSPYYSSTTPTGLSCPDAANCYLLSGGGFSRTTDGGQTWASTAITLSVTQYNPNPYNSISCPDVNVCYVLIHKGSGKGLGTPGNKQYQVIKTTDGGQTWTGLFPLADPNAATSFVNLLCNTPSVCYVSSGYDRLFITNDGGANWMTSNDIGTAFPGNRYTKPTCVQSNRNICYIAATAGYIFKSSDAGQNWSYQLDGIHSIYPIDVDCVDTTVCYTSYYSDLIVEGSTLYTSTVSIAKTSNSGSSWITTSNSTFVNKVSGQLSCPNRFTCYTHNSKDTVYKTSDGGQNWITYSTGITNGLYLLECPATTVCYASIGNGSGSILKTIDSGEHWSIQSITSTSYVNRISCAELNICYAGGAGIYKTSDGGASWTYLTRSVEISTAPPVYSLKCPTYQACYATRSVTGFCQITNPPRQPACDSFLYTKDGGATWTIRDGSAGYQYGLTLSCPDMMTCYAPKTSPAGIRRTSDGAASWTVDSLAPSNSNFLAISCPRTCTTIGDNGAIVSNHHPTAQDVANLLVSLPSAVNTGEATGFTVQARTVSDTVATAYTGTVRFSSTDLAAGLPTEYTFQPGDAGTHTFTATFNTNGSQVLSANDTYYSQMIKGSVVTGVAPCSPEVVTHATDSGNDGCGSLSFAIKTAATSSSPVYTISFQNVPTITLSGPLPVISSTTATTRIRLAGGCTVGEPGVAIMAGAGATASDGLHLQSRVALDGVKVSGFGGYAVTLEGDDNDLTCNQLGLDNGGGLRIGLGAVSASNNRLGNPDDPTSRNIIVGNTGVGIKVEAGTGNLAYYTLVGVGGDGQPVICRAMLYQ